MDNLSTVICDSAYIWGDKSANFSQFLPNRNNRESRPCLGGQQGISLLLSLFYFSLSTETGNVPFPADGDSLVTAYGHCRPEIV